MLEGERDMLEEYQPVRNKARTVVWESHFCGEGIKWDGTVISGSRCYKENNVNGRDHDACFCNDMSRCNEDSHSTASLTTSLVILFLMIFC